MRNEASKCQICFACTGVLLLIVGCIVLMIPNSYEERVLSWEKEVKIYKEETLPLIENTNQQKGEQSSNLFFPSSTSPPVPLGTDVVNPNIVHGVGGSLEQDGAAPSTYWQTSEKINMNHKGLYLYSGGQTNISALTFSPSRFHIAGQKEAGYYEVAKAYSVESFTVEVRCYHDDGCSDRNIRKKCASEAQSRHSSGGAENPLGEKPFLNCHEEDMEFETPWYGGVREHQSATCKYYSYIEAFCTPMQYDSRDKRWVPDAEKKSCAYPFKGEQGRRCSSTRHDKSTVVPFQFKANNDPYITLGKATEGTMDFGISNTTQKVIGLFVLVIGAIIVVIILWYLKTSGVICGNSTRRGAPRVEISPYPSTLDNHNNGEGWQQEGGGGTTSVEMTSKPQPTLPE